MTTQTTTRRQTVTADPAPSWARAAKAHQEAATAALTALIEDVEWLIETREHPARAARRLGYRPVSLERRLRRAGRHDLANYFRPESPRHD